MRKEMGLGGVTTAQDPLRARKLCLCRGQIGLDARSSVTQLDLAELDAVTSLLSEFNQNSLGGSRAGLWVSSLWVAITKLERKTQATIAVVWGREWEPRVEKVNKVESV